MEKKEEERKKFLAAKKKEEADDTDELTESELEDDVKKKDKKENISKKVGDLKLLDKKDEEYIQKQAELSKNHTKVEELRLSTTMKKASIR